MHFSGGDATFEANPGVLIGKGSASGRRFTCYGEGTFQVPRPGRRWPAALHHECPEWLLHMDYQCCSCTTGNANPHTPSVCHTRLTVESYREGCCPQGCCQQASTQACVACCHVT